MEGKEDVLLRELYMLTGKVYKDKDYLYYLLIRDGSYFKSNEPVQKEINDESTVSTLENWFDTL